MFNGSDGNTAGIVAGYAQNVVSEYSQKIVMDFINKSGQKISKATNISPEIRVWYNPELKTRNFMVPGIFGLLLSLITLILTSLAVVKEKEIGTMEQLIVTPLKPYQIIIGKMFGDQVWFYNHRPSIRVIRASGAYHQKSFDMLLL